MAPLFKTNYMKKVLFIIVAILSTSVGIYPSIYLFVHQRFGLLLSKSAALLANVSWNAAFYTHISLGGLALLIGWTQFMPKWRDRHLKVHRRIGKVYVIAALASSLAAIYISFYTTGGIVPGAGFFCLGVIWFLSTFKAYSNIRNGRINSHQKMMVYSYACCFAAVTLRIYLPILSSLLNGFDNAYPIVAWLCWIPNLMVAYFINKRIHQNELSDLNVISIKSSV